MPEKETNSPKRKECEVSDGATSDYVSEDPIILEAFTDIKAAILARRTDIVRQILSAAQACKWYILFYKFNLLNLYLFNLIPGRFFRPYFWQGRGGWF